MTHESHGDLTAVGAVILLAVAAAAGIVYKTYVFVTSTVVTAWLVDVATFWGPYVALTVAACAVFLIASYIVGFLVFEVPLLARGWLDND